MEKSSRDILLNVSFKIFIFSQTAPLKQKLKQDNISFKVMVIHM